MTAANVAAKPTQATEPLDVARNYLARGWAVIPVPHRAKNPGFAGWQQLRLNEDDLPVYFNGRPQNIGVLLGEPSGGLVDIDLDHPRAVELAPDFLPPTGAIFGRAGKPRSHWLYRTPKPTQTKKHNSKSAGMLVEVRSTGQQTVFPPSTHVSGDAIVWVNAAAEPTLVTPEILLHAVQRLVDAVRSELGEFPQRVTTGFTAQPTRHATDNSQQSPGRLELSVSAMLRMQMNDHHDGSRRLYAAACRAVEHDLTDADALAAMRRYAVHQPFPREWSDKEILQRIRDAEQVCRRGKAFAGDSEMSVALGGHDPDSRRLVLSPKRTVPTAAAYVREFHTHRDGRTLHNIDGTFYQWKQNRFVAVADESLKQQLLSWLHQALRYVANRRTGTLELMDFESNPATVKAACETLRSFVHLAIPPLAPCWLSNDPQKPPAHEMLPCPSSLLHLPTMTRMESTPDFFTTTALDWDPDPGAPHPQAWRDFLHQLFRDDVESVELLQEWFGYCLTPDTSQQKMLLIVGPKRSGKGTIGRVLTQLLGMGSTCGPTTASLGTQFGLQPLIGKTLALVSDARFRGENLGTVIERLLCISGEDTLTIDRKHRTCVTQKLTTRFLFLTNELPQLSDASGALASRFLLLRLTESYLGQEDRGLTERLLRELPGILNWAIAGWSRLHQRGHFVLPSKVADVAEDMSRSSSPVAAFVREECDVAPGRRATVDDLHHAWNCWCDREGCQSARTKSAFGRELKAAVAGIECRRSTGQERFYEGIALKGSSAMSNQNGLERQEGSFVTDCRGLSRQFPL